MTRTLPTAVCAGHPVAVETRAAPAKANPHAQHTRRFPLDIDLAATTARNHPPGRARPFVCLFQVCCGVNSKMVSLRTFSWAKKRPQLRLLLGGGFGGWGGYHRAVSRIFTTTARTPCDTLFCATMLTIGSWSNCLRRLSAEIRVSSGKDLMLHIIGVVGTAGGT